MALYQWESKSSFVDCASMNDSCCCGRNGQIILPLLALNYLTLRVQVLLHGRAAPFLDGFHERVLTHLSVHFMRSFHSLLCISLRSIQ